MILYGIGVGPGDPGMVTIGAKRAIEEADAVFLPVSAEGRESVAGGICERVCLEGRALANARPFWFPMTSDAEKRDCEIRRQLEELRPVWEKAQSVAVPVIGDAALYATTAYLYAVWRELCPALELRLVPGVASHSLASCVAGEFMALGEERMSILPGSADPEKLAASLAASDCAALYKPSALGARLPGLIRETGPWAKAVRVHRAGLPEQSIVTGDAATAPTEDYLSVLLLWRDR